MYVLTYNPKMQKFMHTALCVTFFSFLSQRSSHSFLNWLFRIDWKMALFLILNFWGMELLNIFWKEQRCTEIKNQLFSHYHFSDQSLYWVSLVSVVKNAPAKAGDVY